MKNMWTMLFAAVILAGMNACGVVEPEDGNGSKDDTGFQAQTDQPADAGASTDAGQKPDTTDAGSTTETTDSGSTATTGTDSGTADSGNGTSDDSGTQTATSDAGSDPAADSGQPTADAGTADSGMAPAANADVVRSSGPCRLDFSALYVNASVSGEVRGNIPGVSTWDAGPAMNDANADGYLEYAPASLPTGTFDLSYLGAGQWALYGAKEQLRTMKPAALAFVACNWFDGQAETAAASPECHLRIAVDAQCVVTGAGNMAAFK